MVGLHFLYSVLLHKRIDLLTKVNEVWFLPKEKKAYHKIRDYTVKWGVLPKPKGDEPEGFTDEPTEVYFHTLRIRHLLSLIEKLANTEVNMDNVEAVLSKFMAEVSAASSVKEGIVTEEDLGTFIKQVIQDLRVRRVSGLYGIPTGYPTLDAVTGGYIPGDIFVIAGRLKMGKTIYLLNSMRKVCQEKRGLFISMEMSLASVIRRLLFLELKTETLLDHSRIVSSFLDSQIEGLKLKLTLINGATLNDVRDIAYLINFYNSEIVFIDGAYLLPSQNKFNSEWEKAKTIVEELRRIALATKVPIVLTYQLNRQAVKAKQVDTEHIAFTDAVAQSATAVVAVTEADRPNERKLSLIANREGVAGISIRVGFDWLQADFEEKTTTALITEETDGEEREITEDIESA